MSYRRIVHRLFLLGLSLILIACCECPAPTAANQSANKLATPFRLTTNGTVYSIAKGVDGSVYVGGAFSTVSLISGWGLAVDNAQGYPLNMEYPMVSGGSKGIFTAVSDGSGGWYIGGDFTAVGSESRAGLAHLDSRGNLDLNWNPGTDGTVYDIAVSGETIYVAGTFTQVGGESRNRLASISKQGVVSSWNPDVTGTAVTRLAITNGVVYAGGYYSAVGGLARANMAAIDVATGQVLSWKVDTTGGVNSIRVDGNTIYIGGNFTDIAAAGIKYLAAADINSGVVNSTWAPSPNGAVYDIAILSGTVYVGGTFSSIGKTPATRNYLAAVDASTAEATSWDPKPNNIVYRVVEYGGAFYISGNFTSVGTDTSASYVAAIYAGGTVRAWYPGAVMKTATDFVRAVAVDSRNVYIGGQITSVYKTTAKNFAAVGDNGIYKTVPTTDASVRSLSIANSTLYVGGDFTLAGTDARQNAFALDISVAPPSLKAWSPQISGAATSVQAIKVAGSSVYLAGTFATVGGQTRNNLAAVDTSSGSLLDWNPNADGTVMSMAINKGVIYAGGLFNNVGGQARSRVAALDSNGAAVAGWNPGADGVVNALGVANDTIYIGGGFSAVGGQLRANLAAVDVNGYTLSWNPGTNGTVASITTYLDQVAIGGSFTKVAGYSQYYFALLNSSGILGSMNPSPNNTVQTVLIDGHIYTGGAFTSFNSEVRGGIARMNYQGVLE